MQFSLHATLKKKNHVRSARQLFHILYSSAHAFSLPPCVFGYQCSCTITAVLTGPSFGSQTVMCIFLGNSRRKEGCKCHCLVTCRSYVCADVTFFEFTPYFSVDQWKTSTIDDGLYYRLNQFSCCLSFFKFYRRVFIATESR